MTPKKEIILLLLILAIATFFRFWQLDKIPPGLYPDVAINGNDALNSLRTGNFKVFYPENNGREGLMIWFLSLSFSIFGPSIWSIKIVAAIIGILTIFGLYLLTKEIFDKNIALLSSFFLAISFWHTNLSRIGFRAILLPFILVFAFYFLFRGLNNQKIKDFLFSGIIFGLGFYSYTSFRMAIFILPFIFIPYYFIYKKENLQKKFLINTSFFLIFAFFVALPLGIYFLKNPQNFLSRAAPISIFSSENPLKEFGKSLILHLVMFNFYGDQNWRHNFSGSPMLFWPVGILFLIGFGISIKKIIDSWKNKSFSSAINYFSLPIWFFIMLLPGILTFEGIPHALRTIGVIPPVFIFAGLGGIFLFKKIKHSNVLETMRTLFLVIFFLFLIFSEYFRYFVLWAKNIETKNAFSTNYLSMGNYLNSLPQEIQKYVIVNQSGVPVPYPNGIPMPAQTIMFIERTEYKEPRAIYLLPKDLEKIKIEKEAIILPMREDPDLFIELWARFPEGELKKEEEFWIFRINSK